MTENILLVSNIPQEVAYIAYAACAYGCIAAVVILAFVFGFRAKRHVKNEKITFLPQGLSPLDVQRIFIGKTYPRKLTRALLVWWAQCGYIKIEQAGKYTVTVTKLKNMPFHNQEDAVFFDRGTYVRERELFGLFCNKIKREARISLLKPIFSKSEVNGVNGMFAAREDEGVYSSKHYALKIITLILSAAPLVLATVWDCIFMASPVPLVILGMAAIGYFVMMFVHSMPIVFKLIWCGLWLGGSVGAILAMTMYDPFGVTYAAVVMLFAGSFVFVKFVDYREKANLDDYSMLVNYRKFLLFTPANEMGKYDYYPALPYIYAFNIKPFARHKFAFCGLPPWYEPHGGDRGTLI